MELKTALVIHPAFSVHAGGEFLCLNVCSALQELGYHVRLVSDVFRPYDMEKMYGLGSVMEKCEHVQLPEFRTTSSRIFGLRKLMYCRRIQPMFWNTDAEIVFSTQSSSFLVPQRMFHFVYNSKDLLAYPAAAAPIKAKGRGLRRIYLDCLRWSWEFFREKHEKDQDWFFCIGSNVLQDLRNEGYWNSSFALPPSRTNFMPKIPKKNQVVQAARIIPDKGLETYLEIASKLPDYEFYLIGRNEPSLRRLNPGYSDKLLSNLPQNMCYVDAIVRERQDLLEESKVYLYTGVERGIGLAMMEAIAAGCVPLSPQGVGASDVIRASGVGHLYDSAEDAVAKIKALMKTELSEAQVLDISRRADRFSQDSFKRWVKMIALSNRKTPSI
jgi:glycosyltransferase involved in cell wall biosynthesis